MRWNKTTLRSSFFGWLVPSVKPVDPRQRMEQIRGVMLGRLAEIADQSPDMVLALDRKLRKATEMDTLWYARSELLQLMSRHLGERVAQQQMNDITAMFEGFVAAYGAPKKPGQTRRR